MSLIVMIAAAVVLDWSLGDPYWFPHPVRGIGWWVRRLEGWVTRLPLPRRLQGVLLWLGVVGLTWLLCWSLLRGLGLLHPWLAAAGEVIILYTTFAARCLEQESRKIMLTLQKGRLEEARRQLSYIVGRETEDLPEEEVVRATVETVAENTVDGVIAPLFFAFLGGAPLALAYKAVNTLDSMVGYKNDRYLELGWASARIDDGANFLPARLTGFLIPLAALFYNGRFSGSLRMMLRDRKQHASPNSGHPEAAVAGALQVRLGGANRYFGKLVEKPLIGDPLRPLASTMIADTVYLMYGAEILALILFTAVRLWVK